MVCEAAGLVTFDNFKNLIQIGFTQRLFKDSPIVFIEIDTFSNIQPYIIEICNMKYGVIDVLENYIDALRARLYFMYSTQQIC